MGHSETLNRIFIQMLLYWSMLKHGHDGNRKLLTSEYLHSPDGWVDMIESHSRDFDLGYRSFGITHDWWIRNSSLHNISIADAVEYWISKETGFSEEDVKEKRIFLHRCFQTMVEDLSTLMNATAQALVSSLILSSFRDVYSLTIRVIAGQKVEANSQQSFARSFSRFRSSRRRILPHRSLITTSFPRLAT
jgi:hypothetical protein